VRWLALLTLAACGSCGSSTAPSSDAAPGGACSALPDDEMGDGTYYSADGTGNCSFDASPSDLLVAAMNAPDYANAAWCGACLEVTGPMGQVTVREIGRAHV